MLRTTARRKAAERIREGLWQPIGQTLDRFQRRNAAPALPSLRSMAWQRRLELIGRRDAGDFAGEDREAACRAGLAAAIRLRKDAAKLTGTRSEAGLPVTRFISRRMSAIPLCRMSAIPLYGNVGSKDRLAPQVIGRPRTRSAAFFVPALSWSAAMPCAVWRNRRSSLPRVEFRASTLRFV
jgi:hypothetical protein